MGHVDEIKTLRANLKEARQEHQALEVQVRELRSTETSSKVYYYALSQNAMLMSTTSSNSNHLRNNFNSPKPKLTGRTLNSHLRLKNSRSTAVRSILNWPMFKPHMTLSPKHTHPRRLP